MLFLPPVVDNVTLNLARTNVLQNGVLPPPDFVLILSQTFSLVIVLGHAASRAESFDLFNGHAIRTQNSSL
ncbi:hypothetical protein V6N13_042967 [Hibiscus sabdariffa]